MTECSKPTKLSPAESKKRVGRPPLGYDTVCVSYRISENDRAYITERGGVKFLRRLLAAERVREVRRRTEGEE